MSISLGMSSPLPMHGGPGPHPCGPSLDPSLAAGQCGAMALRASLQPDALQPFLVEAEAVPQLVEQGDADLRLQLLARVAAVLERALEDVDHRGLGRRVGRAPLRDRRADEEAHQVLVAAA